ncbi:MAG TPA: hypothetical protein VLB44_23650 [Kofleriaceae bacterium]|nr:hypothetical protein [Kofleriaceae bacterium]
MFRHARYYAPAQVIDVVRDIVVTPDLALVLDVDTLERSALAKIDWVMLLALDALSYAGVRIVFAARHEGERAVRLQQRLGGVVYMNPDEMQLTRLRDRSERLRLLVISDDPDLLASLAPQDCGIALGRPELACSNIAVAGDTSVRATLWWLVDERSRS